LKSTYTNIEDLPLTLKAQEAAAVLRIAKSKVYELAQSVSFPAVRIGKRVVIPRDKLIQRMNSQADSGTKRSDGAAQTDMFPDRCRK